MIWNDGNDEVVCCLGTAVMVVVGGLGGPHATLSLHPSLLPPSVGGDGCCVRGFFGDGGAFGDRVWV